MKCPNCGNTDPKTIEDNGEPFGSPDRTLLCLARVTESVTSYDVATLPSEDFDANGLVPCGWQWEPNEGRDA